MNTILRTGLFLILAATGALAAEPPAPYGPTPSERQLAWHGLESYAFLHFSMNTFTDKEWGYGDESEKTFNPTNFDAEQIVGTFAKSGFQGVILTCKHHDGFCLWQTATTSHSVKNSPWKDGKGDVVREISDACKRHGLKFGVYLSPWDRNSSIYGKPEYITLFRAQLRELLTNYGPVFEVWFDGANGGDGYYGGARERRNIDNRVYYDWDNTWKMVRELQPQAILWSDGGPDARWIGNEQGFAGETCWSTINKAGTGPGYAPGINLNTGQRNGKDWVPAEVNTSIRPGWFYHTSEDSRVKTVSTLLKLYFESVGRGCNLILNVPPDRRGQIHEIDVQNLLAWRKILDGTFKTDLARGAKVTASNTRGGDAKFAPANVVSGKPGAYWSTDDGVNTPELTLELPQPVTFNVVRVCEALPLGQRVDAFAVDAWNKEKGAWEEFGKATSIGSHRLVLTRYLTTDKVRLRITKAAACPAISEVALFSMPAQVVDPKITRTRAGQVSIACETTGPWIRYTLDGSEPTERSPLFERPFDLAKGGTVKACAFLPPNNQKSGVITATFGIAKQNWRLAGAAAATRGGRGMGFGGRGGNPAIDEDPATLWQARGGAPGAAQELVVDLGTTVTVKGFTCLPRQDGKPDGMVDRYEFYVSANGTKWESPAAKGEFANIKSNPLEQVVKLEKPVAGRYVKFVATHLAAGDNATLAELGVLAE